MIDLRLGNCLEEMKKIPDKSIDLVLTDPPYGVNYEGGATNDKKREKLINDFDANIYQKIYPELYRVLKDDGSAYIFYASGREDKVFSIPLFLQYEILIWYKTNASFGAANARYHQDYEPFIYLRKKSGSKWRGGKKERTVWCMKRNGVNYFHPTEKPLWLIKNMVKNSSDKDNLILDPFMGSGTTGVACQELGRNFIGIEINEKYFKIAERRINQSSKELFV